MQKVINFNELKDADLFVDALYKGGSQGNSSDDPLTILLGCGNQGGFRLKKSHKKYTNSFVVLYSTLTNPDWPDNLDYQTGTFTYFGDNKKPGTDLYKTKKKGNLILKDCFDALHSNERYNIPPFFVFTKGANGRDVVFKGLAVPGSYNLTSFEDLVAIWKVKEGMRFQNYKSIFTILDVVSITRAWIDDLKSGNIITENTPSNYVKWVDNGVYTPLKAEKTVEYRNKEQQIPDKDGVKIINAIYNYFEDGYSFEPCAVELVKLMDRNIIECDLTRPWVDGGRDAVGKYKIGLQDNSILVDFALEAKRYGLNNAVGVKETSRLISRLRYRQFGMLITTSYVHHQAYKEIKEDGHPIIIVCAKDIINILKKLGITSVNNVENWLANNFDKKI